MGRAEPGRGHPGVGRLARVGVEVADDDLGVGRRRRVEPGEQGRGLAIALGLGRDRVVEVGDGEERPRPRRQAEPDPVRGALEPEIEPVDVGRLEPRPDEHRVAVLRPAGPAADRPVLPGPAAPMSRSCCIG